EYNASVDINYEIAKGIQFNTRLAYTSGNSSQQTYFEENTEWAANLRRGSYNSSSQTYSEITDPMPFGGELRDQTVRRNNYIVNTRVNFNRFIDRNDKHLLTVEVATDIMSNRISQIQTTNRGYYPGRGHSFAVVDPSKYVSYAY